ncbi:MAG: acyl-CoA dehydrogenase family protein [Bacteroidota bacterium]
MDFSWPKAYLDYKEEVTSFARSLNNDIVRRDLELEFDHDQWQKCATFGLFGLVATEEYGGHQSTVDVEKATLAMEGFGYGCNDNGLALAVGTQLWNVQIFLSDYGSESQKRRYLPKMVSGERIGCHALTEPEAGSDIFQLSTTAEKVDGGYKLDGHKCLITLAPVADYFIIYCATNKQLGQWGLSSFIVERSFDGVQVSQPQPKMGLRTVPIGEVILDGVFVPEENRIGVEGAGFSLINNSLEYDRGCILASNVGAMQRQLEEAIEFSNQRKQYGQSVGKFQSVSNRIVEMKMRHDLAQLLLYKLAWLKNNGKSAMVEAAMLKLYLGEGFLENSLSAIRTRGGLGYLTESEIERDLRDAVGGVLYAGTSDIQRNIIARLIGL